MPGGSAGKVTLLKAVWRRAGFQHGPATRRLTALRPAPVFSIWQFFAKFLVRRTKKCLTSRGGPVKSGLLRRTNAAERLHFPKENVHDDYPGTTV